MRIFFLSLFFLSWASCLFAQSYQSIIDVNQEWEALTCPICRQYPNSSYWTVTVSFAAQDTLIDSLIYREIDNKHVREDNGRFYLLVVTQHRINNNVFTDSTEKLLYDFNAEKGDTLYMNNPGYVNTLGEPNYYAILEVDSIMVNGTWRKRLEVYSDMPSAVANQYYWIEGIGNSIYGVLSYWSPVMAQDYYFCGVRDKSNGQILFDNNSCSDFTSSQNIPTNQDQLQLYPNPTTGVVYLENGNPTPVDVRVYNVSGQLVEQYREVEDYFSIANLQKGVYLVVVQGEEIDDFYQEVIKI